MKLNNEIFKDLKKLSDINKRYSDHVGRLITENHNELESLFPGLITDIKEMVKNNDFEGLKNKSKEVNDNIKAQEDVSKRTNNG